MSKGELLIRELAQSIISATAKHSDICTAVDEFMPSLRRLAERPDLLTLGITGASVHEVARRYLYVDDAMQFVLAKMAKGFALPVHDHRFGWELGFIYRGAVQQKQYERRDDGSKPGHAELTLIDDRIMNEGDFMLMEDGIHTLIGQTDDSYMIGIFGDGWPGEIRTYYQPDRKTYIVRPAGI